MFQAWPANSYDKNQEEFMQSSICFRCFASMVFGSKKWPEKDEQPVMGASSQLKKFSSEGCQVLSACFIPPFSSL